MMRKFIIFAALLALVSMVPGVAMADNIKGRFGVTGKVGFIIPSDNEAEFGFGTNNTDAGLVVGGGLLYGIDDHFAAELDVTNSYFDSEFGDFDVTDISFGGQYRFTNMRDRRLVPYLGAGLDIISTDYDPDFGGRRHVDTTWGVHVSGGVDYFVEKHVALTAEAKAVLAPDADITEDGFHSGDFDPSNFSTAIGVRFFFN